MRVISVGLLAFTLALAGGSACAMSSSEERQARCRVVGGEKLPAASGGASALCAAIEQSMASQAPGKAFTVEVRVLRPWQLSATIRTADGRALPDQNFAVSDSPLTASSYQDFARTLSLELARASSR